MRICRVLQQFVLVLIAGFTVACAAHREFVVLPKSKFVAARAGFQTKLLRAGPSPQEGEPLVPLPGARRVQYRSGGHTLTAYVLVPMTRGPHPAVLFLHGGFAFAAEDLEMARPFQDNGFVVMVPVLRGENGQPGNFTLFYDEVDDVLAAAEALARLPDVNPARIYVTGHSAGGTLALLAAQATTRFRAVTSLSGALDQSHLASPDPHAGDLVRFDVANPKELEMRSPLAFAEELRCPTRYFYGSEELWAAQQSGELVRRASTTGIDVTAEQLIGDHFSYVPLAIQGTISFFRQH